jgi:hypothetical protein
MNLPRSVTLSPDVMARQVGDEVVLLHLTSGNYYGLDPVGARAWHFLVEGLTPAEVCDRLLQEYEVPRQQLEEDISRLIDDLGAHGLVTIGQR